LDASPGLRDAGAKVRKSKREIRRAGYQGIRELVNWLISELVPDNGIPESSLRYEGLNIFRCWMPDEW